MDSDDAFAVTNAIEDMYTSAKYFDADVVHYTGLYEATADGVIVDEKYNTKYNPTDKFLIEENLLMRIQGIVENKFGYAPWRYFIKREVMLENDLFFPNLTTAEDQIFFEI